jgi:hypothetical protein
MLLWNGRSLSAPVPPYPPSQRIQSIEWHWETHRTAAPGSDLWPVTWAGDDNLYTAWGDGGGFGGTDQDGRVALGFGRIEGPTEKFKGFNVNGGKHAENAASFAKRGKAGGMLSCHGVLYAWINRQNGAWPDVDEGLAWSTNMARTWENSSWVFPKGPGNFKPSTFINAGRDYGELPPDLEGFIYFYGIRQGNDTNIYLGRVRVNQIRERAAFEFLSGFGKRNAPAWSVDPRDAQPVFTDAHGLGDLPCVNYCPALNCFLLAIFHKGPGQLGIFDAPHPWGPWTTVGYYEDWGGMGVDGQGLTCNFPQKWMSPDGLTLWCVFSAYGSGAQQGVRAHDQFNLVKATLTLRNTFAK